MLKKLPQEVQNEIKRHILANEYMRAKVLYDAWMASVQNDNVATSTGLAR